MANNETYIAYEGPSLIDGQGIVVLVQTGSRNRKTGDMVQTYILHADIDPITASRTGKDYAICGACPHRGIPHNGDSGTAKERTCYVTLAHGPLGKYKAYKRGVYSRVQGHKAIAQLGAGRMVRLGTYGDPAAVPNYIWESLISEAKGHTAYTHGATNPMPESVMTSADSARDAQAAWARGERTFRVLADKADLLKGREILCPASEEAGKRTTCESCKLCAGSSVKGKSVAIVAHGASKRIAKQRIKESAQ